LHAFVVYGNEQKAQYFWEYGRLCMLRDRAEGRWRHIFPDAFLFYRKGDHLALAFLEWDEGNMREQALAQKRIAYNEFLLPREWRT
jgi:hypothetical protein